MQTPKNGQPKALSVFSREILRIRHLPAFLPEYDHITYFKQSSAIAGWGCKRPARFARKAAEHWHCPYISLEDGLLRSYGLGKNGATPMSLVVDDIGIYFDARKPSRLEQLISTPYPQKELTRARHFIEYVKTHQLTKYNTGKSKTTLPERNYVLVIDQSYNDASVVRGMAGEEDFHAMLTHAHETYPDATLLIKPHSDVLAGKSKGYLPLEHIGSLSHIKIMDEDINPYALFEHAQAVYTVTSLTGMEALIAGKPVYCFGMPFYAGWGLTHDMKTCPRRKKHQEKSPDKPICLEQLVAAAYLHYPRYVNPYDGTPCTAEKVVEILAFIKEYYSHHDYHYVCKGFSRWKRHFVRPYLQSVTNNVRFANSEQHAQELCTNTLSPHRIAIWAAKENITETENITRIEDGFIRSVGLGSDFIPAYSLTIDPVGIHFNYHRPSQLELLLQTHTFPEELLKRARALREQLITHQLTKYNLNSSTVTSLTDQSPRKKILVIGQVEGDASIHYGSPEIKTNAALLAAVRNARPDAYLLYKPHPEIVAGNRRGIVEEADADQIITVSNLATLFQRVDEVHVLTSQAGFEALLYHKPVYTYGLPFYAGWGLTHDTHHCERRTRTLTLDMLVAGALILYPSYFDFESGYPAPVEVIVEKICRNLADIPDKPHKIPMQRWLNGVKSICR